MAFVTSAIFTNATNGATASIDPSGIGRIKGDLLFSGEFKNSHIEITAVAAGVSGCPVGQITGKMPKALDLICDQMDFVIKGDNPNTSITMLYCRETTT